MLGRPDEGQKQSITVNTLKSIAIVVLFLIAVPGIAVDSFFSEDNESFSLSPIESFELWKAEQAKVESQFPDDDSYLLKQFPRIPDSLYPEISPDGRPAGDEPPLPQATPFWQNLSKPPNNTGGGYTTNTHSLGEYQVGDTHESYVGDVNGDGILQYVSYYYHRPSSINGLDDDGDGCVDELTYGNSTGQTGCDSIPDAMVYFETGFVPFLGGIDGDVVVLIDLSGPLSSIKIFKIGVSPKWMAYALRGLYWYPQMVGDFISYYSHEKYSKINSNPEMDGDREDYYVGIIDARGFPVRPPVNRVCSAGHQRPTGGVVHMRDDGWIVGSYSLVETYDNHDWNGDGDIADRVAAYYAVDPNTGSCRQGVNGGVVGEYIMNRGTILTPQWTSELNDNRDWNNDTDLMDNVNLYHDINSTWNLKGRIYTSMTFTAPVPMWGFGWWAISVNFSQSTFPLEFGGTYFRTHWPTSYLWKSYFWLVSDEDGDRHTSLPEYEIGHGQPGGTFGGRCILIYGREFYLAADVTGDGDSLDIVYGVFCPNETGGGGVWVSKGPIIDGEQTPWEFEGFIYYRFTDYVVEDSQGRVAMPFIVCEGLAGGCVRFDLDGDDQWMIPSVWIHLSYLFKMP